MQQHIHRTLRPITPVLPRGKQRPRPITPNLPTDKQRLSLLFSLPGAPAVLLLAALAALGWRAENAAILPHISLPFTSSPTASSPSAPPVPAQFGVTQDGASSTGSGLRHTAAPPAQTTNVSTALTPRVQALALARTEQAALPRSGSKSVVLPPISPAGDDLRAAMAPNPTLAILARPSVSVGVVRAELQRYNSPLLAATWSDGKDAAQYIWDAGRVLGIDPAVLMAFFWHESHYGTSGVARQTDSVGNLRPLAGQPQLGGYRFYRSWQESVDDTYRLLGEYARHGAPTVATTLPVWAPSADGNDVTSYVADVQASMARYYSLSQPAPTAHIRATSDLAAAP